jgi:hypothetical protein
MSDHAVQASLVDIQTTLTVSEKRIHLALQTSTATLVLDNLSTPLTTGFQCRFKHTLEVVQPAIRTSSPISIAQLNSDVPRTGNHYLRILVGHQDLWVAWTLL